MRWALAIRLYAVFLGAIGLTLAAGGFQLLRLGGSPYYLLAGLSMLASSILLWRKSTWGGWIYAALLIGTLGWSLWEVGLSYWALMPRLVAPIVLGLILAMLLSQVKRSTASSTSRVSATFKAWLAGVGTAIAIGVIGLALHSPETPDPVYQVGMDQTLGSPEAGPSASRASADWPFYGGDAGNSRFSTLTQIDKANVSKLKVAWTYRVGPTPAGLGPQTGLEVTPLEIDDTLYVCTGYNDVIALDAENGHERWRFHSQVNVAHVPLANCRGLAYFRAAKSADCPERIITNTVTDELIALNAKTGSLCSDFGSNGRVSLLTGMGEVKPGYYYVTSAPTVIGGNVVVGGAVFDNQYFGEPSGVVRAFDAVTGHFVWAWDVGRPGVKNEPSPGETYTVSTPNSWAPMSVDEELGLVYVPTGSAVPDEFGGLRRPFDDKFSTSIVALDGATGDVRWSFQTVHHDLWDYDLASAPTLIDIPSASGTQHALVQATKTGEIFLIDRRTGTPLSPVDERGVPQSGVVPEERPSATQPYSTGLPSFRGPALSEKSMWGVTPLDQLWCRIQFKGSRYDGAYTPPGLSPSLEYPSVYGGISWGGVSVDPQNSIAIVNSLRLISRIQLVTRAEADKLGVAPLDVASDSAKKSHSGAHSGFGAQSNTPYAVKIQPLLSPLLVPCQAPPYGVLSAVDLRTHRLLWSEPFGTIRDSGPRGRRSHLPLTMGVPEQGGSIVTASGLMFIGASQDRYFRAYDATSGQELWKDSLPTSGNASPMTYQSRQSGRQFVVIAAGGSPTLMQNIGDSIIAYSLPANDSH